jgi:diguanylate cyclase (GGDEF)-like protein
VLAASLRGRRDREVIVATLRLPKELTAPGAPMRPRLYTAFLTVLVILGVAMVVADFAQFRTAATTKPTFWLMVALALLAATRSFVTAGTRGAAVVICPTLCFTFAILLCWGLSAALLAQFAAVAVVAWRLRHGTGRALFVAGQYALAFGAAYLVLLAGQPDPFGEVGFGDALRDAGAVAGAVLAWLVTYGLLAVLAVRLRSGRSPWHRTSATLGFQSLYKAALLMLSPILAVSAHVTVTFIPLIFVPLYAVERMARLSGERERATRLDPLTGLANRTGLQARFDDLVAALPGHPAPVPAGGTVALLLLDLDRFKYVNDTLGHSVGDRLLAAVAERLARVTPAGGVVARLGGDEFALVTGGLPDAGAAEAIAARITEVLAVPVRVDELQIDVTASIGIAAWPEHGRDFATLMRHADVAMYDAKRRGDSSATYQADRDHNSPQRLSLLTDLRRALQSPQDGEVSLHYQPQVALDTGRVVGVEALLRWRHPGRGLVNTPELLQIAEHTTAMHLITRWVIDEAIAQVAEWQANGINLRASVNVSARDLYCGDIVTDLSGRLTRYGVPAGLLQVEVTESALMADPTRAAATIKRIAGLGVAVALDDFGTGYSSLQHLRQLPLAEIKIDRSFVAGMAERDDDAAIVGSTVDLAHALGLRTVAEGVEDERTWRLLAGTGCDLAQGWQASRPMPGREIAGWLARYAGKPTPTKQRRPVPTGETPDFALPVAGPAWRPVIRQRS